MLISEFDFKRFLRALAPHQAGLWGALLCSIISAGIETSIPALLQPLLDNSTPQPGSVASQLQLWMVPTVIIVLFTLRALTNFASSYVMTWSISRMVSDVRNQLFHRILYSDPKLFEKQPSSMLINTVSMETQNAVGALVGSAQTFVKEGLTFIGLLSYMLWSNWKLTLIAFAVLPFVALTVKLTRNRLFKVMAQSQVGVDQITYTLEENVLAYRVVRMQGAQEPQDERFQRENRFLRRALMKMTVAGGLLTPITQMIASVAVAIIVTVAMAQSSQGHLTVGGFAAYIATLLLLIPRAKNLSDVYPGIQRGVIAMQRIYGLLDEPLEKDTGTYAPGRARGAVAFEHITQTYTGADRPAVDDVSFQVAPGETIALVGHSGSGKTTLVNMLPRFIEPSSGTILLDGIALPEWKLTALRDQLAMVSQDVVLFNTSIAENVALGVRNKEDIDRDRVQHALDMAHLWGYIKQLPKGMDTVVGHNGHTLSGGQRQRLAIARALYRDVPILVFDEATSALDAESERLVQLALESLTGTRTTFIVAHRLSTIRNADRIFVLDGGKVVEHGTYAELLQNNGPFAHLVEAQTAMQTAKQEEEALATEQGAAS